MVENYLSADGECEVETVIERSRFITRVARIESEDGARAFIEKVKKQHSAATHNCFAYVASEDGNIMKFSDDGEPQGTAGMPMLEVLRSRRLAMTAAVVTRYFGGIKLGAGGLVRAYSSCVAACLDAANIVSNERSVELKIDLSYDLYPVFMRFVSDKKAVILSSDFSDGVAITCVLPHVFKKSFILGLNDALLGKGKITSGAEYFYRYK